MKLLMATILLVCVCAVSVKAFEIRQTKSSFEFLVDNPPNRSSNHSGSITPEITSNSINPKMNSVDLGLKYSINVMTNLSYSGLSESLRFGIETTKLNFYVGPKINLTKNLSPFSSLPGVSTMLDYRPDCHGKFFLLYEFLPQKVINSYAQIHEWYAGYGYLWEFQSGLTINSGIGIGYYLEKSGSDLPLGYSLNGYSYCSTISIGYRF